MQTCGDLEFTGVNCDIISTVYVESAVVPSSGRKQDVCVLLLSMNAEITYWEVRSELRWTVLWAQNICFVPKTYLVFCHLVGA